MYKICRGTEEQLMHLHKAGIPVPDHPMNKPSFSKVLNDLVPKEVRDELGVFLRQVRTKERENAAYAKQKQSKRALQDVSKSKEGEDKKQQEKSKRKSSKTIRKNKSKPKSRKGTWSLEEIQLSFGCRSKQEQINSDKT